MQALPTMSRCSWCATTGLRREADSKTPSVSLSTVGFGAAEFQTGSRPL